MIAARASIAHLPVRLTLAVAAVVLALAFALSKAPSLGVMPILAAGFLCGPALVVAWAVLYRPVILFVATFAALAPIDFLLTFGGTATLTRFVALGAVGALVLSIVMHGAHATMPRSVKAWLFAYCFMVASLVWAGDPARSMERLMQTGLSLLVVVLVSVVPCDRVDLRAIVLAIAAGGAAVAAYAIVVHPHMQNNAARIALTGGGMTIDPNGLAFALLPALGIGAAAALTKGDLRRRIGGALIVPLIMAAIVDTQSRGALLAVGAMAVWIGIRSRRPLVVFALTLIAGIGVAASSTLFSRFSDLEGAGRASIWRVGAEAFRQHWLIGNGYGTFADAYDQAYLLVPHHFHSGWSREPHDLIISVFVELGIFGGALVLYAWWCQFRQLVSIPADDRDAWLRLAAEAGILGVFVAALFLDILVLKPAWIVPLLIAAVANVRAREAAAAGLRDPVPMAEGTIATTLAPPILRA